MYVITEKRDNVILGIGNTIDYMENDYPRLVNENVAFPTELVNVSQVDSVPEEIVGGRYCYTAEKGFYPNASWKEPNKFGLSDEQIAELEQDTIDKLVQEVSKA